MLTSDLIRARRSGESIVVRFLDQPTRARVRPIAEAYLSIYRSMQGASRSMIDEALGAVEVTARDRVIALGLQKLCEDRSEFSAKGGLDAEAVREALVSRSALAHRAATHEQGFDRAPIVSEVAELFGTTPDAIEEAMFSDLRTNQLLVTFDPLTVDDLLGRYDVGLVQALVLRATRLEVEILAATPQEVRGLFRIARFFGLLHVATTTERGHSFVFDGPMSLFEAAQRYGIKLAMFVPYVLRLGRFALTAEVRYGAARTPLTLRLDHASVKQASLKQASLKQGAIDLDGAVIARRPELASLVAAFDALSSAWKARDCEEIIALPGEVVCAPDLVFENTKTGECVYFELFGFWSRAAVFQRVDLVKKGFPGRIILAAGKNLRVSAELLDEDQGGELMIYKTTISAKELLARLDRSR